MSVSRRDESTICAFGGVAASLRIIGGVAVSLGNAPGFASVPVDDLPIESRGAAVVAWAFRDGETMGLRSATKAEVGAFSAATRGRSFALSGVF